MGVKLAEIVIDSLLKVQLFCATVCWGATQRGTPENMQSRFDPVSSLLVFVKIEMYNE